MNMYYITYNTRHDYKVPN